MSIKNRRAPITYKTLFLGLVLMNLVTMAAVLTPNLKPQLTSVSAQTLNNPPASASKITSPALSGSQPQVLGANTGVNVAWQNINSDVNISGKLTTSSQAIFNTGGNATDPTVTIHTPNGTPYALAFVRDDFGDGPELYATDKNSLFVRSELMSNTLYAINNLQLPYNDTAPYGDTSGNNCAYGDIRVFQDNGPYTPNIYDPNYPNGTCHGYGSNQPGSAPYSDDVVVCEERYINGGYKNVWVCLN